MSRYIVLREAGAAETLLIDKATLTVSRLNAEEVQALGTPATAERFAGLEFGFAVGMRTEASARVYYKEELSVAG